MAAIAVREGACYRNLSKIKMAALHLQIYLRSMELDLTFHWQEALLHMDNVCRNAYGEGNDLLEILLRICCVLFDIYGRLENAVSL